MNIMYTVHMHASIYTAVSKKVVPQKSQTLNSKRSRCDGLLKARNVRILHCNYGKTDYKHLRCTTNSVLGLFAHPKALKRSYPSLFARLEFEIFEGQPFLN